MARLIDADALIKTLRISADDAWNHQVAPVSWAEAFEEFIDDVGDAPTVDAVPMVRGRWIDYYADFECSVCGDVSEYESNYCSKCGAKMDGDVK